MVDFAKFGTNIESMINAHPHVGFAIAIYNGLDLEWSAGHGVAERDFNTPMTSRTRLAVMSTSKTITAAAVVKQIATMQNDDSDFTLNSKIEPYLPHTWQRGPKVGDLTFRRLLTHTSGLQEQHGSPDSDPDSYESLREAIKIGAQSFPTSTEYRNLNFCLFRVILPYLVYGPEQMKFLHDALGAAFPMTLGMAYVDHVTTHVLKLCNIEGVSVVPSGPQPFLKSYNIADLSNGIPDSSGTYPYLHTGAGYWNMSTREYGRFIAHLRHGSIMHRAHWGWMRDGGLGLFGYTGKNGQYFWHNGGVPNTAYGAWMAFPDGTTAVLFANSTDNTGKAPQDILATAYDAA